MFGFFVMAKHIKVIFVKKTCSFRDREQIKVTTFQKGFFESFSNFQSTWQAAGDNVGCYTGN